MRSHRRCAAAAAVAAATATAHSTGSSPPLLSAASPLRSSHHSTATYASISTHAATAAHAILCAEHGIDALSTATPAIEIWLSHLSAERRGVHGPIDVSSSSAEPPLRRRLLMHWQRLHLRSLRREDARDQAVERIGLTGDQSAQLLSCERQVDLDGRRLRRRLQRRLDPRLIVLMRLHRRADVLVRAHRWHLHRLWSRPSKLHWLRWRR